MRSMALELGDMADAIETPEKERETYNNIMQRQDLNRDGKLSPREFYGSAYSTFEEEFEGEHDELWY